MRGPTINADAVVQLWDRVRTSLWFVPGLLVAAALGLAVATPLADTLIPDAWARRSLLVFSGRAAAARAVLGTIATSTIGVAGVVFSMTIVSLQLASSQFGPRLLRTFLRDRGNQVVLGTFLGTFLYCIVVMPTVDSSGDSTFVPHVAVTLAVLLAIVSLAMLVYYIDHVAQSIHADAVMAAVGRELESVIEDLFPEEVGTDGPSDADREPVEAVRERDPIPLVADASGYLRFVNGDRLLALAEAHDLVVHVRIRPGSFATDGTHLADVRGDGPVDDETLRALRATFVLSAHRTTLQDVLFTFEQVSEVAMRAMSPGVNDPTTAVHGIDRIGAGIAQLVTREIPAPWRADSTGTARVRIDAVTLPEVLEQTVVAVSRTAGVHLPVWTRLVEVLRFAAERAVRPEDRRSLAACADRLAASGDESLASPADRERLRRAAAWTAA